MPHREGRTLLPVRDPAPPARGGHRRYHSRRDHHELARHLETRFIRQAVNDTVIDAALEMIGRYALRAYDAVQLAGCRVLGATTSDAFTFVCSDHRLLEAARSGRLKALDPAE